MSRKIWKKILSITLCLVMLVSYLPDMGLFTFAGPVYAVEKNADPSTIDWESYFGPNKMDTEFAGGVWTDKSVFSDETAQLPGVTLSDSNHFLVALSAIAANLSIIGHTSAPTDTMLVLDLSGSMVDGTYEVGTVRQGNSYQAVAGIDMSLINAMIEATNATIDKLMQQNTNNRVGVVLYSGNTASNQAATPGTATVVLPLGRYAGINGGYLSVDTTWRTDALYTYRNRRWQATGETATYVAAGTAVRVSVADGLKTETGANVTDTSKQATGGTYIQNGLYQAMGQFLDVTDTTVPEGKLQAGAERLPVLVLMTDGAPTIATTSYTNIGNSNTGDGTATNDRITFLTQLTAAYVRGRVASHYQENGDDDKDMLFLTMGLGTENSSAATNTLYPAGSNANLVSYWDRYLAATPGNNVTAITGNNPLTVRREADVEAMNYVDTYYYANNAQGLIDSFKDIVSEISLKAESYATLVEGGNANFSGYVTFEDELGELMQVADVKGVLMSDGNGGTVLYSGMDIAKGMSDGNLGTVDGPTERGHELVRTVMERIPGTTTTQAQQLIDNAYNDGQLYYADDNNWSNYIGWYADANGNYVGFWDKESGYENAPAGAVYANRSYGYLGANGDSDMMHVVVMVRTELATLHQTVYFKIPASLLPTVQYRVTLNEEDPTRVETFEREGAIPMQLVFEVGLRPDVNSVNMEQKIAEHVAKGGHVHRNADGTVTFYTNEWAIGNDKNGNGIPDPDEVESALVAESHFHPAMDNSRYYYTEDTPVLDAAGNPVTGTTRPTGDHFHHRYIYNQTQRVTMTLPIAADTLANKAEYDTQKGYWYIPAGTIFSEVSRFRQDKTANVTGSLSYSNFPAVFENGQKQDVYSFLGNNGALTVAPATGITLRKQLQGTIEGVSAYTFEIALSNIPAGTAAFPVLTDADGQTLPGVTMSAVTNDRFTVTMPANVTAYISGIPVGTTVQIAEQIGGDYKVVDIQVAGQKQAVDAPATATVPAYAAGVSQMVPVVITNAPNGYGNLVISKDVVHALIADPAAMSGKEFTFRVKLAGSKIAAGDAFRTSENAIVTVGADGNLTYENGDPIRLKNEESVTIFHIPEGTTYTITEDSMEGFALESINGVIGAPQASGTIGANSESLEAFLNRYPDEFERVEVPVELDVTKVLNQLSPYTGNEEFAFVLQMLLADGTYPSIAADNGSEYLLVGADETLQGAYTLTFEDMGTYFFRVVELKPSEQTPAGTDTPGMSYSTMRALFEVVVTDDDMNGVLEVAVREEANVTVTPQYTDGDPEQIEKITVAATFTNQYEVNATSITLPVHKDLNNNTGAVKPLTGFHFTMRPSDASGNVAAGAQVTRVTTSALGDATFNIFLDAAGTYHYKITEDIPAGAVLDSQTGKYVLNGMSYDPTEYLYTVVTEVQGSSLVVTDRTLKNLTTGQTVAPANGVYTALFTNEYALTSTDVFLSFSKQLTGRDPVAGERYETRLVRTDAGFKPLTGADAWNGSYFISPNTGSTVQLTFDRVGMYYYKWTEVIPAAAVVDPVTGRYVLDGVIYDTSEYHIAVTVSDNGAGGLTARTVMHKLGGITPVTSADFVNAYGVTGSERVAFGGRKILDGRALVAGEFTIGLYGDPECNNLIETTTNRADGTFAFSAITYTAAHLGAGNAAKTYTYYVKEVPGSKGGVTYDDQAYTVTVTVSHENGALVVTPSANAATLQIRNTYEALPVDVRLLGRKALSGDWSAVRNQDFTFHLYAADSRFVITDTNPVRTETVTGNVGFTMALHYEDGQEGTYYFVLKEVIPATRAGGVSYDAGEYHVTVKVSDPGNGRLTAMVTMYRPGTGNTSTAVFTNDYSVEPVFVTLEGTKKYVNSVTGADLQMEEGAFSFAVLEDGDLVATGHNLADGTIEFSPIRYTAAGKHTYSVVELPGDAGGVTYDTETAFTVTVDVVDNGDGTLTATTNYYNTPAVFENTYTHQSAQVTLDGVKDLSGDWSAVADTGKVFDFELYETGSNFVIGDTPVDHTTNGLDGRFSFGTRTFTTAGTYYFVVLERGADTDNGITYDDTRYYVTVVVEDDGQGNLIPTVTASDSRVTITTYTDNSRLVTVGNLAFTNSYEAKPARSTPEAQKVYEGDEMKEFDFILTVDGAEKQKKQNDADGKVAFDTLTFDTAGVYELTIREQENILFDLIRWDTNVYTITLHVEDNGAGELLVNESKTQITSQKGTDDLIFRNTHHSVITDKDVFVATEPTISIDGKTVDKGDILLYEISYTNYDSVPVDVTIVDAIPQYTTYVDGSADNGGQLTDGVLEWTLEDVAPDATVTVSFRVKVAAAGITVVNGATVLEGGNTYSTNEVTNPVGEDTVVKDVFLAADPAASIDGKAVNPGDVLTYEITYTNADDFAAEVTILDTIPEHTTYVDGSADNGGTFADGVLTWRLNLAAGESSTVSFRVRVADADASVTNQATALEGENKLETNRVTSPVEQDDLVKDVFRVTDPTVSIDGQMVQLGDVLVYTITYTNSDAFAAEVTITDAIPEHTAYVDGSADNGAVFADGVLTWHLTLAAGESKTVSFRVAVAGEGVMLVNQAQAFDGVNTTRTNTVVTTVPDAPRSPKTGDNTSLWLWFALLFVSGGAVFTLTKKREQTNAVEQ